ncbi:MAG: DUF11 domain-containing protein [Chloroflexi bacterium]|nr:DUF11 domain-containing protein [Chloroflexota bacterium]
MTERKERIEQVLHDLAAEPVQAGDEFKQRLITTLQQEQRNISQAQTGLRLGDSFVYWLRSRWSQPILRWASIMVTLVLALVGILTPWMWRRPRLTIHQGVAQISSQQSSAPESQKSQGDVISVAEGVRITLDEGSTASLLLFNGNKVELLAGTQLTITKVQPRSMWQAQTVRLQMTTGQVQVQVSPLRSPDERFEVDLPAALVSVHGTTFRAQVISSQHTYVATDEGVVSVTLYDPSQGNPLVKVPAGYQVDAIIGQPLQVRRQESSGSVITPHPSPEATRIRSETAPSPTLLAGDVVIATATSSPSTTVIPSVQVTSTMSTTGAIGSGNTITDAPSIPLVGSPSPVDSTMTIESVSADLEIVLMDVPNPTAAEGTVTYMLLVANHGPVDAQDVVIRDFLPPQVRLVKTTLPVMKVEGDQTATFVVGWRLETLPAGDRRAIQVTVAVHSWVTQSFTNTVIVTTATPDRNPLNNQATVETAVTDVADLAIFAQIPAVAGAGDVVTYTLVYTNLGPAAAYNVTIVEQLAPEILFGGVTNMGPWLPSQTAITGTLMIEELVPMAWTTPKLTAGAFGRLVFTATVQPDVLGPLTSTVGIVSQSPDSDSDNNDHEHVMLVMPVANVAIAQNVTPNPVVVGSVLTYTLTYTNHGPWAAENVVITTMLPLSVTVPSSITLNGPASSDWIMLTPTGQSLAWFTPSLLSGMSGTIVLTVTVDQRAADPLYSRVIIHSTTRDNNPDDNTATGSVDTLTPALSLLPTVHPNVIAPHQPCTYTFYVTNTGAVTFAAQSLSLVGMLPPGFRPVTITNTQSETLPQAWVWHNSASLAPGKSFSVSFVMSATETVSPGLYLSTAGAVATVPGDPITATASVSVRLTRPSVAVVQQMIGDGANTTASDRVTLTIHLINTGPSPLATVPLTERYDPHMLRFVGAIPNSEKSSDDGTVDWSNLIQSPPHGIGRDLFSGETLTVTLVFSVTRPLTLTGPVESHVTIGQLYDVYGNFSDGYTIGGDVFGMRPLYMPMVIRSS